MRLKFLLVVPCLLSLVAEPVRSEGQIPPAVARAMKEAGIPPHSAAFFVQEVGGAKPLLAINAQQPMNPASTIKLLTTYAGLQLLGPAYVWKTEAYVSGNLQNEILDGNLVLKGYGDPKLTLENFWLLLRSLRQRGLKEIRGDLIFDRSYFAAANHDSGSFDDKPLRAYNVGPDALLVNFRATNLQFVPDPEKNTVAIIADPKPAQLEIINNLALSAGPCGDWRDKLKADFQNDGTIARLRIKGTFPAACGEKTHNLVLFENSDYVYAVFKQLWEQLGGTVTGTWRDAELPQGSRLLAAAESPPLSEVVRDINKFSNNVMARQLFLSIGAAIQQPPASLEHASGAIKHWLAQKKLHFPELVLENGAGLSRRERISPEHLGQLLLDAYQSAVMPEFIAALPIVSVDGTMKKRLNEHALAGRAHIKTGFLEGVRAIAGYMLDSKGRIVVAVFIINHPNAVNAEPAQDALLEWVYERP